MKKENKEKKGKISKDIEGASDRSEVEKLSEELLEEKESFNNPILTKIFGLFKSKTGDVKKKLDSSKYTKKKPKEKKVEFKKHKLKYYIEKAGLEIEQKQVEKIIFNACIVIISFLSIYLIYFFAKTKTYSVPFILFVMVLVWVFVFVLVMLALWLLFYLFLDVRMYQRKISIENVLADYLLLVSANIRSGMTVDRALFYAVRPRFGVLAKEIEVVAKETMSGEDLEAAMTRFADKYDSVMLKRSISLMNEGINAGGEIGDLLSRISQNIQETQLMKKEMAANVMNYIIFITFASVVAAPFLFGLSFQLLQTVTKIIGGIDAPAASASSSFSLSANSSINPNDFLIFCYVSLSITSFFSSIIIATIKKGDLKGGIKYVPMFIITAILMFFIASWMLSGMFSNMF